MQRSWVCLRRGNIVEDTNPSEEISGGVIWLLVALVIVGLLVLAASVAGAAMGG